jgi:hypothetical protein
MGSFTASFGGELLITVTQYSPLEHVIINSNHLKEEAKENTLDNQPKLLQI